jgi:hypothetical protein
VLLEHATGFRTLLTFSSAERLPLLRHSSPPAEYTSQKSFTYRILAKYTLRQTQPQETTAQHQ